MNGTDIRFLRRLLDLTQGDLADALGVSATWVGLVERNRVAPSREQLQVIERLLGYPICREWTGKVRKADARRSKAKA